MRPLSPVSPLLPAAKWKCGYPSVRRSRAGSGAVAFGHCARIPPVSPIIVPSTTPPPPPWGARPPCPLPPETPALFQPFGKRPRAGRAVEALILMRTCSISRHALKLALPVFICYAIVTHKCPRQCAGGSVGGSLSPQLTPRMASAVFPAAPCLSVFRRLSGILGLSGGGGWGRAPSQARSVFSCAPFPRRPCAAVVGGLCFSAWGSGALAPSPPAWLRGVYSCAPVGRIWGASAVCMAIIVFSLSAAIMTIIDTVLSNDHHNLHHHPLAAVPPSRPPVGGKPRPCVHPLWGCPLPPHNFNSGGCPPEPPNLGVYAGRSALFFGAVWWGGGSLA